MSTNITIRWLDDKDGNDRSAREGRFPQGVNAAAALDTLGIAREGMAAVYVNNEIQPFSAPIETNAALSPVPLATHEGRVIYRASLAFLLCAAASRALPARRLVVGHSLGNGYYYHFAGGKPAGRDELTHLKETLAALIKADTPITFHYMAYEEALTLFRDNGQTGTVMLLEQRAAAKTPVYRCADWTDLAVETLVPRTGILRTFDIFPYEDGFLLRYPTSLSGGTIGPFEDSPKVFAVYKEYKKWGRIVHLHSAGTLNRLTAERRVKDFIRIAETFHAKKLSDAADAIYARRADARIVLIAGPSSSGKTTTAKRIAVQLQVLGMEPVAISLDDYYNPPDAAPKDEEGNPDLECLEALDVPYLNEQLRGLLAGKEITLPQFDFKTNTRKEGRNIRINRRSVVILEGIHGLNDRLTPAVPGAAKFKLYVSPLTQLNLDDHNRVPTADNRLVRRLVRDNQFRNAGALKTLAMWPSVRRGELRHIFPYQNSADYVFNSALDYELAVLKFYAEPLLRTVKPRETAFAEAARLLRFLENFTPVPPQMVPPESILREFIGGSDFKY
jgi:uridine kinase